MLKPTIVSKQVFSIIAITILISTYLIHGVYGVESRELLKSIEDNSKENLSYINSKIDEKGFATGLEEADVLKATARLGLLAGYIHMALGDEDSLRTLNKIMTAVEDLSKAFEERYEQKYDRLLAGFTVLDFVVIHYGLTGSESSKKVMMKVCGNLVKDFGWNPITSCSTYLLSSIHISLISGGIPRRQDVENALEEIKERYLDFINFTSLGKRNLAIGLQILSTALKTALSSRTPLPPEVVALWEVHLNYSLNYIKEYREKLESEQYEIFLASFISALETDYKTPLREDLIRESEKIAEKLMENWISGGRLILQNKDSYSYLIYDPSLDFHQLLEIYNKLPKIRVYDLNLPLLLLRLSKIDGVEKRNEFREASIIAVNIVLSSKPYFKMMKEEITRHHEFIDRLFSTSFLSSWYVVEKAERRYPHEIEIALVGQSYYTLIASSLVLFTLLVLHRIGKLIKVERS